MKHLFSEQQTVCQMEDRSGGSSGDPTLSYSKDQILALRPSQHLQRSGRNSSDKFKASSSPVINYLTHSSNSLSSPIEPSLSSAVLAAGQGLSSWPPGLAAWVEEQIFPVLLPQQVSKKLFPSLVALLQT